MAILGLGKKEKEDKKPESKASSDTVAPKDVAKKPANKPAVKPKARTTEALDLNVARSQNLAGVLLAPRITEKASFATERGVYVFMVAKRATKRDIADAVRSIYKVSPRKVCIAQIPSKKRISQMRRMKGIKAGGKKAYVYLKKGDSIEFM